MKLHLRPRPYQAGDINMQELITRINDKTGEPIIEERAALSGFYYVNGYRLSCTDLGKHGVKIELMHKQEGSGAIILPPKKAEECGGWLLQTMGQRGLNLPEELSQILKRLIKEKRLDRILKRGDKKMIRDVLKFLRGKQSRNWSWC